MIMDKKCPRCRKSKPLERFGTRMVRGKKIPQSYCLECRNRHKIKMQKLEQKIPEAKKLDLRTKKAKAKLSKLQLA